MLVNCFLKGNFDSKLPSLFRKYVDDVLLDVSLHMQLEKLGGDSLAWILEYYFCFLNP